MGIWEYAYKGIFTSSFIKRYVEERYHVERIQRLVPPVEKGDMFFEVAVNDDVVVGFCNIGLHPKPELYRIYLQPAYIGQGVGSTLLRDGENFLKQHNATMYFCYVHKHNTIGKAFYTRKQFLHRNEHDKEDEWYMEKLVT